MFCCAKKCCCRASNRRLDTARAQMGSTLAQTRGLLVPLALDAKDRLVPLAQDAKDRLVPLALDAKDRLVPLAADAKDRFIPLAEAAVDRARARAVEVVESDVLPRLADWREQAAPIVDEAAHRGQLALSAIKGETLVPVVVPPKRGHPVLRIIGLAALAGTIWLIVKTLLGARDDGWQVEDVDFEDTDEIDPEPEAPEPADPERYGAGAYVGPNPPEGYTIKGNERSMKYHVPTALGYERTVTNLWFNSPEAAEAAGFTRALR